MNYFSRIELDERHPGAPEAVGQTFGSAHSDHQFLWRFFPAADGSTRDFLFRRFDPQGERGQALFYCVSQRPAVAPHPAWQVQSREYAPRVEARDRLRFDLRVNPTQARERDGKSRRDDVVMHAKKRIMAEHGVTRWADVPEASRVPLYELTHKSVHEWLGDSSRPGVAIRNGFHVLGDLRVDAYRQHRIPRGGQRDISLTTVDLSGTLEVGDPAAFAAALLGGIGHAKGFGCGLLLVRRP